EADLFGGFHKIFRSALHIQVHAGNEWDTLRADSVPGRNLVTHNLDSFRRGADESNPFIEARLRKFGTFGEEAVAGVDRVRVGALCYIKDFVNPQIAFARRWRANVICLSGIAYVHGVAVGIGIDGDCAQAQLAAGTDYPHGDLTTIGDQDFSK